MQSQNSKEAIVQKQRNTNDKTTFFLVKEKKDSPQHILEDCGLGMSQTGQSACFKN